MHHGAISSEYRQISCELPQGSILGPVLFALYISDLPNYIKHSKIVLYAVDAVLLYSSEDLSEISRHLAYDLKTVSQWLHSNNYKLHLNVFKCKGTLFGVAASGSGNHLEFSVRGGLGH